MGSGMLGVLAANDGTARNSVRASAAGTFMAGRKPILPSRFFRMQARGRPAAVRTVDTSPAGCYVPRPLKIGPRRRVESAMPELKLGTKYECYNCGTKFYD